ncbi:exo-alpha-sialidase [Martelella soudanensis]|uniref:exo-alpha-sialidase n=1 Tax=unclassified Martelella TaxID=2629616 RepID=UPI0015DEED69|nr:MULTISPECIES: sialidase family protein [unclassified Martelella]
MDYAWRPLTKIADNGEDGAVSKYPATNPVFHCDAGKMRLFWQMTSDGTQSSSQLRMRAGSVSNAFDSILSVRWTTPVDGDPLTTSVSGDDFLNAAAALCPNTWPLLNGVFEPRKSYEKAPLFSSEKGHNLTAPEVDAAAIDAMVDALVARIRDFDNTYLNDVKQQLSENRPTLRPILDRLRRFSDILRFFDAFHAHLKRNTLIVFLYMVYDTYSMVVMRLTVFNMFSPDRYDRGWQTRSQPQKIKLENGADRLLLPVHSNAVNLSVVLYSDDDGTTWKYAETPILGRGTVEPSIVQRPSGKLTAFLRTKAPGLYLNRVAVSDSCDYGITWSPAVPVLNANIKSRDSGISALSLKHSKFDPSLGPFIVVYTPDQDGRNLHLSVGFFGTSSDRGNRPLAWLEPICLEQADNGCRIGDPSVTEGDDGTLYISCSYHVPNEDGACEKICVIQYDGLRS